MSVLNVESQTATSVVSSGPSENGRHYLRMVDGEQELTLPLRPAEHQHKSFILATWVKSYLPTLRKKLGVHEGLVKEEARMAETLWGRTWIVTSPDDDFTVHAWVCGSQGKLDYVYVPPELRKKGIATALIAHCCGRDYEYSRPWPFKGAPPGNASFNPYLLGRS